METAKQHWQERLQQQWQQEAEEDDARRERQLAESAGNKENRGALPVKPLQVIRPDGKVNMPYAMLLATLQMGGLTGPEAGAQGRGWEEEDLFPAGAACLAGTAHMEPGPGALNIKAVVLSLTQRWRRSKSL